MNKRKKYGREQNRKKNVLFDGKKRKNTARIDLDGLAASLRAQARIEKKLYYHQNRWSTRIKLPLVESQSKYILLLNFSSKTRVDTCQTTIYAHETRTLCGWPMRPT